MVKHTTLKAVSATGGFLRDCRVEFSPGLTCIIGARGTCKSTIVESIRFAFDCEPRRVKELIGDSEIHSSPTFNLVRATLGAGSIRCETTSSDSADYSDLVIEREVGGGPRVFLDGVREHAGKDVLQQIEIFSQGDLQLIADDKNEDLRIDLIDRPNATTVKRLKADRERWEKILRDLGPRLRLIRAQISGIKQELQPLTAIREQLRQAREQSPALSPELENERLMFERRRQAMNMLREIDALRVESLTSLRQAMSNMERMSSLIQAARQDSIVAASPVDAELETLTEAIAATLASSQRIGEVPMARALEVLHADFEELNAPFYRMRQEQQVVNESLKQQQHLTRQVELLEKRQNELNTLREDEAKLLRERQEARTATSLIDDELFALRISEVDQINLTHGGTVALTLRTGASSPRYGARLSSLLGGSRVRGQEEVASVLAETFSPAILIDVVETGSGQVFADTLDRDLGQMNRVVAHLSEHPDLYTLEAEPPMARLEITLFDNGQPKPVETLSRGQKATALLPLILRPLPYPLIVDQPEDDLDNNFIFRSLVRNIQLLKQERQLIFVTHNANIPVLGEAERVVVMHMQSPHLAAPCIAGSVDERKQEILDLLEGGAEAFQQREERYHDLLISPPNQRP